MRFDLKKLMEKLGVNRALSPYETQPWYHYDAAKGITCNVIAPGYIATEMVQAMPKDVLEGKIIPQIPVGRLGTAQEIARCVAFLAADDAGFITGACLDANGGQYMA